MNNTKTKLRTSAEWVGSLLEARGYTPEMLEKENRYWDVVSSGINLDITPNSLYNAGIAAHAEEMRLKRIEVIANDFDAQDDIRFTFGKILIDERFHAKAFKLIAGEANYEATMLNQAAGAIALGLIP